MKFEIKSRYGASILFSLETDSLKLCVEAAIKGGADLGGADLGGVDLGGAYLGGADLGGAYLGGAYLRGADLGGADLRGADLRGADLGGADLGGVDLCGADLGGADLRGADLGGAYLGENKTLKLIGDRPYLQIGPIGSRADYLTAFITDAGVYVRTGCFFGTLENFRAAVQETHGTRSTIHLAEYTAAITMIEAHASLWTQAEAKTEAA
jgi:hypothetical protein